MYYYNSINALLKQGIISYIACLTLSSLIYKNKIMLWCHFSLYILVYDCPLDYQVSICVTSAIICWVVMCVTMCHPCQVVSSCDKSNVIMSPVSGFVLVIIVSMSSITGANILFMNLVDLVTSGVQWYPFPCPSMLMKE